MQKATIIPKSTYKEAIVKKPLTIVPQQKDSGVKLVGKYEGWAMPPIRERYIKHSDHDPL